MSIPILESLAPKECLIISRDQTGLLVAINKNGDIELKHILYPQDSKDVIESPVNSETKTHIKSSQDPDSWPNKVLKTVVHPVARRILNSLDPSTLTVTCGEGRGEESGPTYVRVFEGLVGLRVLLPTGSKVKRGKKHFKLYRINPKMKQLLGLVKLLDQIAIQLETIEKEEHEQLLKSREWIFSKWLDQEKKLGGAPRG